MRIFHLITQGYAGAFSLNNLGYGRIDEVARFIHNTLFLSHTIRRDTVAKVTMTQGPLAPLTVILEGKTIRGLHPDERSIAGYLLSVLEKFSSGKDLPPGIKIETGISLPPGTVLDENGERKKPKNQYFYVGGPYGFPIDPPGEKISIGGKVYTASQTVTIVHYMLDVGVWIPALKL